MGSLRQPLLGTEPPPLPEPGGCREQGGGLRRFDAAPGCNFGPRRPPVPGREQRGEAPARQLSPPAARPRTRREKFGGPEPPAQPPRSPRCCGQPRDGAAPGAVPGPPEPCRAVPPAPTVAARAGGAHKAGVGGRPALPCAPRGAAAFVPARRRPPPPPPPPGGAGTGSLLPPPPPIPPAPRLPPARPRCPAAPGTFVAARPRAAPSPRTKEHVRERHRRAASRRDGLRVPGRAPPSGPAPVPVPALTWRRRPALLGALLGARRGPAGFVPAPRPGGAASRSAPLPPRRRRRPAGSGAGARPRARARAAGSAGVGAAPGVCQRRGSAHAEQRGRARPRSAPGAPQPRARLPAGPL
ncbi:uncharacterized protein [Anas platyrhynchos]|uniref:uncharacterized protein n=1 Tax=Anas platyrhynchos TaxID=8839 RepID=UPI003AF2F5B1